MNALNFFIEIDYQGPVVQSIVNLTKSLKHQLIKYNMLTTLSNILLFLVEKKCENLIAKDSHIFPTKINKYL